MPAQTLVFRPSQSQPYRTRATCSGRTNHPFTLPLLPTKTRSIEPQSRVGALERESASLSEDLKARERDVANLLEQKRALEDEVSRAQRALSRGAVETASMAQGELALQVSEYLTALTLSCFGGTSLLRAASSVYATC